MFKQSTKSGSQQMLLARELDSIGFTESLIQVAKKKILRATVRHARSTNDGVQTSIKIEALMNSRLLTYGGADDREES